MSKRTVTDPTPLIVLVLLSAFLAVPSLAQDRGASSCVACHGDPELFEEEDLAHVEAHAGSIHADVGVSCHDCHGGNPDPELALEMDAAMDPDYEPNPYVGSPERTAIPGFCGECHSDLEYMRRFDPEARVDQVTEYWTSDHGKALREGDTAVATCTDCHGSHRVLAVDSPESRVYPTEVAETCAGCHSDPATMAGYETGRGDDLPVNQYALWQQSVHGLAMSERGDLSAPTCNDCHGNHGATPPGVQSIGFVCGQCHGREAELFRASTKHELQMEHAEYLADAGEEGCAACHDPSEPQAQLSGIRSFGECDVCHGHHGVVRPSVAMLSPLPRTPCAFCHEPAGNGELQTAESGEAEGDDGTGTEATGEGEAEPPPLTVAEISGERYQETRDRLIEEYGEVEDPDLLFDWMVDRALELPMHTEPGDLEQPELRDEFARLFEKFRIGKTHYSYTDPTTGAVETRQVRRCSHCHGPEPVLGEPTGWQTSKALLADIQALTSRGAYAERLVLDAHRGGVATLRAEEAIDGVVDSQIELQALVHSFTVAEDSEFVETQQEGLEYASTAISAAEEALDELSFRRVGLGVSLVFILVLVIGLGFFVRDLPDEVREVEES